MARLFFSVQFFLPMMSINYLYIPKSVSGACSKGILVWSKKKECALEISLATQITPD